MRTTAEIVREAVAKAMMAEKPYPCEGNTMFTHVLVTATLAATYACELAQADAAALLEPVRMRKEEGGTRR